MIQLPLFPEQSTAITIKVINYGDYYQAEIAGGWWIARGRNKQSAIKAVIKRYKDEVYYDNQG